MILLLRLLMVMMLQEIPNKILFRFFSCFFILILVAFTLFSIFFFLFFCVLFILQSNQEMNSCYNKTTFCICMYVCLFEYVFYGFSMFIPFCWDFISSSTRFELILPKDISSLSPFRKQIHQHFQHYNHLWKSSLLTSSTFEKHSVN